MFHLIAIAGHLPLFQFFVEQLSADLHVANETSQCNLVMMLCAHGHIDILRYIFQRNASCTTDLKQQLEAQDKVR